MKNLLLTIFISLSILTCCHDSKKYEKLFMKAFSEDQIETYKALDKAIQKNLNREFSYRQIVINISTNKSEVPMVSEQERLRLKKMIESSGLFDEIWTLQHKFPPNFDEITEIRGDKPVKNENTQSIYIFNKNGSYVEGLKEIPKSHKIISNYLEAKLEYDIRDPRRIAKGLAHDIKYYDDIVKYIVITEFYIPEIVRK